VYQPVTLLMYFDLFICKTSAQYQSARSEIKASSAIKKILISYYQYQIQIVTAWKTTRVTVFMVAKFCEITIVYR
jgi:hypothetical protein